MYTSVQRILLLKFLAQPLKVFSGTGKEEVVPMDYPLEASSSISEMTWIGGTLCQAKALEGAGIGEVPTRSSIPGSIS